MELTAATDAAVTLEPPAAGRGRLLEGDCLEHLAALASEGARFDLVYVDPPYATGLQHRARVSAGLRMDGPVAYDDAWGGIEPFLEMLEPRLRALCPVLSERASVWLHLDHRAVHETKVAADRIFGRAAFQGEVIWVPGNGARRRQGLSVTHQTLLVYAPGTMIWNDAEPALREPYARSSLDTHFRQRDKDGRRFRERKVGGRAYRYYADEGRRLGSVWDDCPAMAANTPLLAESTGYPTQKPESLLDRIVRGATFAESCVLDPMCGSGTALAVAARLKRSWVGIDESPLACRVARERLSLPPG